VLAACAGGVLDVCAGVLAVCVELLALGGFGTVCVLEALAGVLACVEELALGGFGTLCAEAAEAAAGVLDAGGMFFGVAVSAALLTGPPAAFAGTADLKSPALLVAAIAGLPPLFFASSCGLLAAVCS